MAGEVVVDALPYIDQGYDDPGVRESVSRNDTGIIRTGLVIITVLRKTPQDPIDTMEQEQAYVANSFKSKGVTAFKVTIFAAKSTYHKLAYKSRPYNYMANKA